MVNTPKGERMNICFVGRTNVGKSSILNQIVGQDVSIISEKAGTTTDPVSKRYELNPMGAVTFFDTAGYDDTSELGKQRLAATLKTINKADLAVVVIDDSGFHETDIAFIQRLEEMKIPFLIVKNKADLPSANSGQHKSPHIPPCKGGQCVPSHFGAMTVRSTETIPYSIYSKDENSLKEKIVSKLQSIKDRERFLIKDFIQKNDKIVLVMPIDSAAPKGRIILPQVQVLREILDVGAIAICCNVTRRDAFMPSESFRSNDGTVSFRSNDSTIENELTEALNSLKEPPRLVITDSQVINQINKIVPEDISLTTFSILFARYRGELEVFLKGLKALKDMKANDEILIAEGCSHHKTCEDIGSVKIPQWLEEYLEFAPKIDKANGGDFPTDLKKYRLVIHCGACMLNRAEMIHRMNECDKQGVAITNFGMLISEINGVLKRTVKEFFEL